jgi:Mycotoxin biosynthesis protein UstYa
MRRANVSVPDVGINRIDGAMAAQLPNRTTRIPGDDDGYVVGLDVLHQLHCLNILRKSLYPDRYNLYEHLVGIELTLAKNHTGLFLSPSLAFANCF